MTVTDLLQDARERIADPSHFVQIHMTADARGRPTSALDAPDTVRYCAYGTMLVSYAKLGAHPSIGVDADDLLCRMADELFGRSSYVDVSDHFGHDAILQVFDAAIERSQRG